MLSPRFFLYMLFQMLDIDFVPCLVIVICCLFLYYYMALSCLLSWRIYFIVFMQFLLMCAEQLPHKIPLYGTLVEISFLSLSLSHPVMASVICFPVCCNIYLLFWMRMHARRLHRYDMFFFSLVLLLLLFLGVLWVCVRFS